MSYKTAFRSYLLFCFFFKMVGSIVQKVLLLYSGSLAHCQHLLTAPMVVLHHAPFTKYPKLTLTLHLMLEYIHNAHF